MMPAAFRAPRGLVHSAQISCGVRILYAFIKTVSNGLYHEALFTWQICVSGKNKQLHNSAIEPFVAWMGVRKLYSHAQNKIKQVEEIVFQSMGGFFLLLYDLWNKRQFESSNYSLAFHVQQHKTAAAALVSVKV